jgi:hypothetical protein
MLMVPLAPFFVAYEPVTFPLVSEYPVVVSATPEKVTLEGAAEGQSIVKEVLLVEPLSNEEHALLFDLMGFNTSPVADVGPPDGLDTHPPRVLAVTVSVSLVL